MKGRKRFRYLKWDQEIIAEIDPQNQVHFINPSYNQVVALYTRGREFWSSEQFREFLTERIVSRDRRDIERILFRCGLSHYEVLQLAEITRAIHPKDLLWLANDPEETLVEVMTQVFESVFRQKIDLVGESLDTPEGYNIKRYGVCNRAYGIFKQRLHPLATDVESEVAVYLLAQKLGVPCCPACRTDKNTMFSEFCYDFSQEYIVHFRRLFGGVRSKNEYQNLLAVRPQYQADFIRMIVLDFITRQDDRHLSNMALKVSGSQESFYPLYDNGRSLFYEDTEEMVQEALADVEGYATSFGYSGTYWDYIQEIKAEGVEIGSLVNLKITREEIAGILKKADFTGYRYWGALEWINRTLDKLKCK